MKHFAVLLSLLALGCSNNSDSHLKIGTKKLIAVRQTTVMYNQNSDVTSTGNTTVTIENDQATKIQYGEWYKENFYYKENLLNKRVRVSGSIPFDSTLYTYDTRGRILKIENNRTPSYPISNQTSYLGNEINPDYALEICASGLSITV